MVHSTVFRDFKQVTHESGPLAVDNCINIVDNPPLAAMTITPTLTSAVPASLPPLWQ